MRSRVPFRTVLSPAVRSAATFPRSLPALATCVLSVFCAGPGTGLFTFLF